MANFIKVTDMGNNTVIWINQLTISNFQDAGDDQTLLQNIDGTSIIVKESPQIIVRQINAQMIQQ